MQRGTARTNVPRVGLYDSIKIFTHSLIEVVRTRVELLSVELAEEKARLVSLLLLAGGALICLMLTLIFAASFALVLSWDTPYRLWVAGLIPAVFLTAGALLVWAVYRRTRSGMRLFSASLREMSRDVELLTRRDEHTA